MRVLAVSLLVAVIALPRASYAGDAAWVVCKGVAEQGKSAARLYIVVSVLDRRTGKGDGREQAITLIKGDHVSRGIVGAKGVLATRDIAGRKSIVFDGTATLPDDLSSLSLRGTIDPTFGVDRKATREPATATLACEQLDDLAIGH
jgi:hypothetical protein